MTQPQLALVTGASSGIGLELAKQFALNGYDLVVAAEDDAIRDVAGQLSQWSAAVQPIQVDLRTPEGVEHLYQSAIEGDRVLAAAALNAGVGRGEMFLKSELADDLSIVDLNVRSTVHLAKLVLRDMANRDSGKCCSPRPSRPRCRVRISRYTTHRSRSSSRSLRRSVTNCATPQSPSRR